MLDLIRKIKEKKIKISISDEASKIFDLFARVNNLEKNDISELLQKLGVKYPTTLIIEEKQKLTCDDFLEIPEYIGSIGFKKEISAENYNANKYVKEIYYQTKMNTYLSRLNHTIHLFKDGIILELNFNYDNGARNKTQVQYREYFKVNRLVNDFNLDKEKDSIEVVGSVGSYIVRYPRYYKREQIDNNTIRITFISEEYKDHREFVIYMHKDKNQTIKFNNEKEFIKKIWSSALPSSNVVVAYLLNYYEMNNIDVPYITINSIINGVKEELIYELQSDNLQQDQNGPRLIKKLTPQKNQGNK